MSSQGEYYGYRKIGDKYVALYDEDQELQGPSFDTELQAQDFIEADQLQMEAES